MMGFGIRLCGLGLVLLMVLLLAVTGAAPAGAHGVSLTALVRWRAPETLEVQIVDPYESPLEGLQIEVRLADGSREPLAEVAPGRYAAQVGPGAGQVAGPEPGRSGAQGGPGAEQVTVQFRAAGDQYRAVARGGGTADLPEQAVPMAHLPGGAGAWVEVAVFGGGFLAVCILGGVVLLRRGPAAAG